MKLYERYGDGGFHSCISTTFGVDFDAYENIVLPRLRGGGCFNNVLLADSNMLTYALDGASVLPEHAGRHYSVVGAPADGVFHPKLTLQLGRRQGRAIIASANMTAAGLAGNLELAGQIEANGETAGEAQLMAAAWAYLSANIDADSQAVSHQLQWIRARTPWLLDASPASGPVSLADGSLAALLTRGGVPTTAGIGTRFAQLISERPVGRLIVLSPYWDDDLAALKALISRLAPEAVAILIDTGTALFPVRAAGDLQGTEIFDLNGFGKERFIHAKAIIVETAQADHLLYGSANCTAAALGTENYPGANHEVCLYRRLPPGTMLSWLGLSDIVHKALAVPLSSLPDYRKEETIPLVEAGRRSPGEFECTFDVLLWRPPATDSTNADIELLDAAGAPIPMRLTPLTSGTDGSHRFQITGTAARPAFGRLRYPGGNISAPAIVTVVDMLRETVREARSKKAESAAIQLSEETEEGLWLWEVLNELEAAELAQDADASPGAKRTRQDEHEADAAEHRTLPYDQFIAGRRLRSDAAGPAQNSLVGSELSLVRDFLNRILTMGETSATPDAEDEAAIASALNLGDETANAASALEEGEEFSPTPEANAGDQEEEVRRQRAARAKASREQIVQAVRKFNGRLKEKCEAGQLGSFDVLRLRAMFMIIAAAALPLRPPSEPTSLQVLPLSDEADGWPKLMGQLLFAFFGGNRPAIGYLHIEPIHDQLPDDVFECWVTAMWSVQACACAAAMHKKMRDSALPLLTRLSEQLYARTGLQVGELAGERQKLIFEKLSERFADRLGIDPAQIDAAHARTRMTVFSSD